MSEGQDWLSPTISASPVPVVELICPHCSESVEVTPRPATGNVELAGCPQCTLQLVRREDGPWKGIRG